MNKLKKLAKIIWKYKWKAFVVLTTIANIASTIEQVIDKKYELAFTQGSFTFAFIVDIFLYKFVINQDKMIDIQDEVIDSQDKLIKQNEKSIALRDEIIAKQYESISRKPVEKILNPSISMELKTEDD